MSSSPTRLDEKRDKESASIEQNDRAAAVTDEEKENVHSASYVR